MQNDPINTFSLVMIGMGCLVGVLFLVIVIRGALRGRHGETGGWTLRGAAQTVPAIARSTLAEGIRAKVATGFALLILISVPLFYLTADGDGTIKGRIQMFMAYSFGFSAFLMSLLTILFSCRSLSREIESRQIFGLVSKPVPRWQILAGKWTGIMILNIALVGLVGVTTYAGTQLILSRFKSQLRHELQTVGGLTPEQAARAVAALNNVKGVGVEGANSPVVTAMKDATGMSRTEVVDVLLRLPESTRVDLRRFDELRRQVLVARVATSPQLPVDEIREKVIARYQALKQEGRLSEGIPESELIESIRQEALGAYYSVPPLSGKRWELKGPPPDDRDDLILSLRFKISTSELLAPWHNPQNPAIRLEDDVMLCTWVVGRQQLTGPQPVRAFQEVELPMDVVDDDGTVLLEFHNLDPRRPSVYFELPEAIEVLYVVGSFESNVIRACIAILVPLMCLTSFGVLASTFLTFPVAALMLMCLYVISSSMGFVADSFAVTSDYINPDVDYGIMLEIRKTVVSLMGTALSIGDLDPVGKLIEGRAVTWPRIFDAFWKYDLVKGGIAMFVAVIVFRRRELAAVTV